MGPWASSSPYLSLIIHCIHGDDTLGGRKVTRTPRQKERLAGGHGLMLLLPLDASRSLPDFVELDLQGKVLPEGVGPGDVKAFQVLYREHCEVGQSDGE